MVEIGNKCRWFNIVEFVLIVGLRCVGDLDKNRFKTGDDSFKDQYVKDYGKFLYYD